MLCLFLIKNHAVVVFMPATTAKRSLFPNHRNRKVVGGCCTHNGLVHYVDISAPNLFGVVFCNPFKWHFLWLISDQKSCFWYEQQKRNEFYSLTFNHMDRKVVRGNHNVLIHYEDAWAPILFGAVFCNPFKWDILLCVHSHFFVKIDYEIYNWPIGWRNVRFTSLVSLLVSNNVGSHTAPHILGI